MSQAPVIIVGMHRSGTSLLSRILEKTGIFMGVKKDENNESLFFLKFNDWILKQAGATWDNPYNYTLVDEDFKSLMTDLAKKYIKSIRRIEYLGLKKSLKYKNLEELDFPWGWKDPRNTFTLDIWLKVFPNAKIIHIYRNPIDVAESLRNRTLKMRKNFKWNIIKNLKLLFTIGSIKYGDSAISTDILACIKLWEFYIEHLYKIEKDLNLNIFHIKYESLLENPAYQIQSILNFIGLANDKKIENKIITITKEIDSSKKYKFLNNKNLYRIYKEIQNSEILKKLQYDNI